MVSRRENRSSLRAQRIPHSKERREGCGVPSARTRKEERDAFELNPRIGIAVGDVEALGDPVNVGENGKGGSEFLKLEAARSLGLGTFKTFRLIVFPQAFKTAMPPLTGQFVALLKETVICSVVGIPELLREALVVQSWTANPTPLIIATIGYLLLLVPLTRLSRYLEVRMSTVRQAC